MDELDSYYDRNPLMKCVFTCVILLTFTEREILRIFPFLYEYLNYDIQIQI